MAFEETAEELTKNVASWASIWTTWSARKKLALDYVHIERSEIEETGEYDLEGLFIRLGYAIDSIGAKRVVLDTIEALFAGLAERRDPAGRAAPAVPLAQGQRRDRHHHRRAGREGHLTRHGLEEYVSDCVILLDHRVDGADLHPAAADRQVPRLDPRHQRVSVPDRRSRASRSCRSPRSGLTTRSPSERISTGDPAPGRHAGRQGLLPGQQHPGLRHGRHRQDQPGRRISSMPPAGAASAASISPSRNRRPRSSATCAPSASTWSRWVKKGLLQIPRAAGPRSTAWRCTW